jgi:hypothetical protein
MCIIFKDSLGFAHAFRTRGRLDLACVALPLRTARGICRAALEDSMPGVERGDTTPGIEPKR